MIRKKRGREVSGLTLPAAKRTNKESYVNVEAIDLIAAIGHILLGGMFVVAGVRHFFIMPMIVDSVGKRGVPYPKFVILVGTVFQLSAGACLVFGFYATHAAAGLIGFTLAASVMLLNFWDMKDQDRMNAISGWQTNLGIIGGLLIALAQAAS
jgi:putative oxidoreductase